MWVDVRPGLWRSVDGTYVILRTVLPEDRPAPTETYTLRKLNPDTVAAYPGTLGYFRGEHYTLEEAQQHAERDAYCSEHAAEMNVPEDFPSLALQRFFWPISEGVTRGALAVVREGDRILVRVVGMSRHVHEFEPGVWAEIDITGVCINLADEPTAPRPEDR
jgi:hypothetical protein